MPHKSSVMEVEEQPQV